jgi:hypothetical protein
MNSEQSEGTSALNKIPTCPIRLSRVGNDTIKLHDFAMLDQHGLAQCVPIANDPIADPILNQIAFKVCPSALIDLLTEQLQVG